MKYADWSFKLRSYLGAVDQRCQEELMETESSSTPRLNANLGSEESALSTQMYYILVKGLRPAVRLNTLTQTHNPKPQTPNPKP